MTQKIYLDNQGHPKNGKYYENYESIICWYQNGLRHREDGPAIYDEQWGHKWFLYGIRLTKEQFESYTHYLEKKTMVEKFEQELSLKSIESLKIKI